MTSTGRSANFSGSRVANNARDASSSSAIVVVVHKGTSRANQFLKLGMGHLNPKQKSLDYVRLARWVDRSEDGCGRACMRHRGMPRQRSHWLGDDGILMSPAHSTGDHISGRVADVGFYTYETSVSRTFK